MTQSAAAAEKLAETVAEGVRQLLAGADWQHLLQLASRMPSYSARNLLLLWIQGQRRGISPTHVAGYRRWAELGRQVRRGETALRILAPVTYREEPDPKTGEPGRRVVRGFRSAAVFDVSQTNGPDLPATPQLLAGSAPVELWSALSALLVADGYRIERGDCGEANGWVEYSSRVVRIRADVDELQATKTLAHELAHVQADHENRGPGIGRARREIEAESIASVLLQAHGLDSAEYTLPYVAHWAGGDAQKVLESLDTVARTSNAILTKLTAHVASQTA